MASRAILSNSFEEQRNQNHPQYLSGFSLALFPTTCLKIAVYTKENDTFWTKEAGILRLFRHCRLKSKPKARKDGFSRVFPEKNWKRWITSDDASMHQHILTFRGNENSLTR